ncbi:LOW QUALITY PROTEIN: uncharacterized protein RCH25_044692 [Pelodytes ibericus]
MACCAHSRDSRVSSGVPSVKAVSAMRNNCDGGQDIKQFVLRGAKVQFQPFARTLTFLGMKMTMGMLEQPDRTGAITIGDHSAQYAEIYAYTHALKETMLVEGLVLIVTDSAYLARSTVQDLSFWCSNCFLTRCRKPLQHIALWKQIDAYLQKKPDIEVMQGPAHRKLGSSLHTVGHQLINSLRRSVSQRYSVNVVTRSQKHALSLNLDAELNACMDKTRPNPPGYPTKYSYRLEGVTCIVTIDDKDLIVYPVKEREKRALEAHAGLGQAHLGRDNVLATLKEKYWWLKIRKTFVHVISDCKQCLLVNRLNHSVVPFIEKSIPKVPFELLYIDHIGPMPPSHCYIYILICVDTCIRFTWLYPVQSATSNTMIYSPTSLASIGKPRINPSDGGPAFIAKEMQNWATTFGLLWEICAPNQPLSSGVVERKNAELKLLLTKLLVACPTQWYPLNPILQMGINNLPNATNGITPFEMLKPKDPEEKLADSQPRSRLNHDLTSKPVLMKTEEDEQMVIFSQLLQKIQ